MQPSTRRTGFTLVEILVVVAITAILAALLLAVFSRVRENGSLSTCQNQLKQLILAVQQYTADNDGFTPADISFQRQLFPYIKSPALIECPTHQARSFPFPVKPDSQNYIFGYWYNGPQLTTRNKQNGALSFKARQEASLEVQSKIWVFADDNPSPNPQAGEGGFLAYSQCDTSGGFWATLHNGGANYAFLDGHTKWLTPSAINKIACADLSP